MISNRLERRLALLLLVDIKKTMANILVLFFIF